MCLSPWENFFLNSNAWIHCNPLCRITREKNFKSSQGERGIAKIDGKLLVRHDRRIALPNF